MARQVYSKLIELWNKYNYKRLKFQNNFHLQSCLSWNNTTKLGISGKKFLHGLQMTIKDETFC